jgi:outer membrane protein assembly factor BamA
VQRAGDIKLEANVEYRFGIFSFLNGAVFLDAGNIWLLKNDSTRVGGKFETQNFLKEIAIGTGVGLRFDFSFLVLRFPLYNPILPDRERWIINKIDFFSKDWRRENLTFNVAIGYPF